MKIDMALVGGFVHQLIGEIRAMQAAFREKGTNRFARCVVLGTLVVLGAYQLIYAPPEKKSRNIRREIQTAKLTAEYADTYKTQRDRLREIFAVLPDYKDRDGWLQDRLVESLKAENITPDSIAPPETMEINGLYSQTIEVAMTLRFSELVGWLNRIEQHKPLIHVSNLAIDKTAENIGFVQVRCTVGTTIPMPESVR